MNHLTGKSTGIALLMAAAMLAALFALGVFSVGSVGADSHLCVEDDDATPAVICAQLQSLPTITGQGTGNTIEPNFVDTTYAYTLDVDRSSTRLDVVLPEGESGAVATITSPPDAFPGENLDETTDIDESLYNIDLTEGVVNAITIEVTATAATDDTEVGGPTMYTITLDHDLATDKTEPGSIQSLEVQGQVEYTSTDNITVNLKDFGVPPSIDPKHILVGRETNANPSDVEVDGTKVTLVAPFTDSADADLASDGSAGETTTITFRRAAEISLPIRHSDYDIKVSTVESPEADGDGVQNWVTVRRQVKVSPTSGVRGTEVTITGKGFLDGTATISIGTYNVNAEADDGAFTLKVDTAVKDNNGKNAFDGSTSVDPDDDTTDDDRDTTITVSDSGLNPATTSFEIKPSFTFDPESPTPGQDVTITLVDISNSPDSVTFTGAPAIVNVPASGEGVTPVVEAITRIRADTDTTTSTGWIVQVPGNTRVGNVRVTIVHDGADDPLVKTITIGTNDLTVTPSTIVPRQTISIDGTGFTKRGNVDLNEVEIDGKKVSATSVALADRELINNNGDISFEVTVPDDVTSGSGRTVEVIDNGDRVGTAKVTVAKAEVTVEPAESLRGETITVSGTGFPANDLVLIKYNTSTVDTSSTSPTGTFEKEITVPSGSAINPGGEYKVAAESQVNTKKVSDDTDHKIMDPAITLSPDTATPGGTITITGSNFKGFLRVASIVIGGQDVTPVPAPSTDVWGSFTASNIQVPQLDLTRHAVKVVVGKADGTDGDATEFLTLEAAPVSQAPADVFADLIDNGSLSRVWYLERATQEWSFFDPAPEFAPFNTLNEVSTGQIVDIIMNAEDTFQGETLFVGSNPIAIE